MPADVMFDLAGMLRIQGAMVDMGAYESVPEPTVLMMMVPGILALAYGRYFEPAP